MPMCQLFLARRYRCVVLLGILSALAGVFPSASARAADWSLNVHGFSYFPNRNAARNSNADEEFSPGIGARVDHVTEQPWVRQFLEAGYFRDAGEHSAIYASAGVQLSLTQRLFAGATLSYLDSATYNNGEGFLAPIPRAGWKFDHFEFHIMYFPKYKEFNHTKTFGIFLSIPLDQFMQRPK